jgi:hypothetical protein
MDFGQCRAHPLSLPAFTLHAIATAETTMNRKELAVTIAGLIATFALPWPQSDAAPELRRTTAAATQAAGCRAALGLYGIFGRVRTGPAEGIQPTR